MCLAPPPRLPTKYARDRWLHAQSRGHKLRLGACVSFGLLVFVVVTTIQVLSRAVEDAKQDVACLESSIEEPPATTFELPIGSQGRRLISDTALRASGTASELGYMLNPSSSSRLATGTPGRSARSGRPKY